MTKEIFPRKQAYGMLREFIIHIDYFKELSKGLKSKSDWKNIKPAFNPKTKIKEGDTIEAINKFKDYISKNNSKEWDEDSLAEHFLCFQLTFFELNMFNKEIDINFIKESKALDLIQKSLAVSVVKNGQFNYLNTRLSVLKFYHLYRLKKFTFDWYSHIAVEATVIDKNKHKTSDLIDEILWWIPELKGKYNAQFVSKGVRYYKMELKRTAGKALSIGLRDQCEDFIDDSKISFNLIFESEKLNIDEKREMIDKLCSKEGYEIQLEHPLDRHIAKCYIENLCVEMSLKYPKSNSSEIRDKIINAIDKLSVVFFGCLVTKSEHQKLGKSLEIIKQEKIMSKKFGDYTPKKGAEDHKTLFKQIEEMKANLKDQKNKLLLDNLKISKYISNPLKEYSSLGIKVYYIDSNQEYTEVEDFSNVVDLIEPTYHPEKLMIDTDEYIWEATRWLKA